MGINRSRPLSYKLRLSEDMHQWLKTNAEKNYRTLATEINMHLENARKAIEEQEKQNATAK